MIYFIPSWYKQHSWDVNERNWYENKAKSEYDDTVKQIQLFHRRAVMPYQVVILGQMPQLRHFLHRQGIFRANYWSCFDAIAEINRKKISMFSFKNLKWPEGIEFEYSPFVIEAYLRTKKYAQIYFGEDGNLIKVDMYKDNKVIRSNIYDDRGFVARSVIFEDGKEQFCEYYMENGIWKMRRYAENGHVEINPNYPNFVLRYNGSEYSLSFSKHEYDSLDEVIMEVTAEYVALTDEEDMFCVAMHPMNLDVIEQGFFNRKTILSFYENRFEFDNLRDSRDKIRKIMDEASYIITDSGATTMFVEDAMPECITKICDISPYDSRKDFGISQQMPVYKVLVLVDELQDEVFDQIILLTYRYMCDNDKVQVHLFTRNADYAAVDSIYTRTVQVLKKSGAEDLVSNPFEDKATVTKEKHKYYINQCVDEMSVNRCIREQRILIDMREKCDQYIQIAAISAGIPQIVRAENEYLEDGKNGIVLGNLDGLNKAMAYYLESLANWNEAMIWAYKIGEKYSTHVLLDKWREVIETVEQG